MAINFNQQEIKKSKLSPRTLFLVFLLLLVSGLAWFFLIQKPKNEELKNSSEAATIWKQIDIKLDILKDPVLNSLQDFQIIPEFTGKVGRDNPFK